MQNNTRIFAQQKTKKTMKTLDQIAAQIKTEAESGKLTTIKQIRERITELCKENKQESYVFSLAYSLGIA
jgi:L-lactate utilization protein LutC